MLLTAPFVGPSGSPRNLSAVVLSSTSIDVSWAPPDDENHNGVIIHYTISVTVQETGDSFQHQTDDLKFQLTDLRPYRTHLISVGASTSVCPGPFSSEISAKTLEDGLFISFSFYGQTLHF